MGRRGATPHGSTGVPVNAAREEPVAQGGGAATKTCHGRPAPMHRGPGRAGHGRDPVAQCRAQRRWAGPNAVRPYESHTVAAATPTYWADCAHVPGLLAGMCAAYKGSKMPACSGRNIFGLNHLPFGTRKLVEKPVVIAYMPTGST